MGNSLQDQLLKTGSASKQQGQKASLDKRKKRKKKSTDANDIVDDARARVQRVQSEKAARDRELNRLKQEEAGRNAIAAQIKQLIELNRLPRDAGEMPYNFVDGTRVCKVLVPEDVHAQLGRGRLSIVRFGDGYEVVPTAVANKISERDASVIIARNQTDELADEDDPYADYQVPDDLMW